MTTQTDSLLRPCERTYIINGVTIDPDIINRLASRNNFLYWMHDNKGKVTLDEIYDITEAVFDNWRRFILST